jgi:hypothetical protein
LLTEELDVFIFTYDSFSFLFSRCLQDVGNQGQRAQVDAGGIEDGLADGDADVSPATAD